jgi:SAM-dependent methyltransferase
LRIPARRRRWKRPVRLGTIRRTTPVSDRWGWDRGTPVDRRYIESFLAEHRGDIKGRVLEVGDSRYTDLYREQVTQGDIIDVDTSNKNATIVADLSAPDPPSDPTFDCFLLIQTLQYVYDVAAAVRGAHRLLRQGGVVLATVPTVSRIARSSGVDADYWRFTSASTRRLFEDVFGVDRVEVWAYGNVLAGVAFLMGLAAEELKENELDERDEFFPVLVAVRAVKSA